MNRLAALAAVLSVGVFFWVAHASRNRSRRLRLLQMAVLLVCSVPSLLFVVYYLHVLPERAWFYQLRSYAGSEFWILFLGAQMGMVAASLPRLLLGVPLVALVLVAVVPYLKPILYPLPEDAFHEKWRGNACLQSTSATCGPAGVATILKALGTSTTEHDVARASYTYYGGTEAWYLARAVRRLGYDSYFEFQETFSPRAVLPALVGVRLGGTGHFIAVLSIKDGEVTYSDSLEGERHLPLAQFLRRYQFTGFHMCVMKRSMGSRT